jgi:septal ring-binding cell division protein DamX
MFRMRAAGYRGPDLFPGSVVKQITRTSLGLTRRVNLIADKALLAAFSENTHTLKSKHIEAAVRDSEFSQQPPRRVEPGHFWAAAALLAAGAVLGIGVYALVQDAGREPAIQAQTQAVPAEQAGAAVAETAVPAPVKPAQPQPAAASGPLPDMATPAVPVPARQTADTGTKTAAATVSDGKTTGGNDADLLEARLAATRQWLSTEPHTSLSIQLMGTNDPEQLKDLLNSMGKVVEINKVFVYRTVARKQPSLTVLYGSFSNPRDAREALDKLPASLRASRPILRTVQGIRAEIKQHQPS